MCHVFQIVQTYRDQIGHYKNMIRNIGCNVLVQVEHVHSPQLRFIQCQKTLNVYQLLNVDINGSAEVPQS